ncbi:MAG: hypothetical protein K2H01_09340 [Ruminococcus sp.]|nr:hypothetical protein [Ruminococcus sp.]
MKNEILLLLGTILSVVFFLCASFHEKRRSRTFIYGAAVGISLLMGVIVVLNFIIGNPIIIKNI